MAIPELPAVGERSRGMTGPSVAKARRRVLIVEDELLIGDLLEGMVADLGHEVVAVVPRVEDALAVIERSELDFAIVDIRLHDDSALPVADALIAKGVPFVFATGLGESGLPQSYRGLPILQKPFTKLDLERELNALGQSRKSAQGSA
jgi:two-component SAPR family response regulator